MIPGRIEPIDPTMKQIIVELGQCSEETKRLALGALRGIISAASEK